MTLKEKTRRASCCAPVAREKPRGFWQGLLFGLLPHTFCILFVVFSVVGATVASTLLSRLLYLPYFFQLIVALGFVFATLSAALYLRRNGLLSWAGARRKWRYLLTMYATTIGVNLLFFWVVFPALANLDLRPVRAGAAVSAQAVSVQSVRLSVDIPCPGHAPLIIGEVEKVDGVLDCQYEGQNIFVTKYDSTRTSVQQIMAQEVFASFAAKTVP